MGAAGKKHAPRVARQRHAYFFLPFLPPPPFLPFLLSILATSPRHCTPRVSAWIFIAFESQYEVASWMRFLNLRRISSSSSQDYALA